MCWVWCAVLVGALTGSVACAPPTAAVPPALPSYSPADAALFDDTFSMDIFGSAAVEPPAPLEKLQERVVLADGVVPVTISAVTRDSAGGARSAYTLTLKPNGRELVGLPLRTPLDVMLNARSPAFVRVGGAEAALVGKDVILMFRRYDVQGKEVLHWRAEFDNEAVRTAITKATAVRAARAAD